MLYGHDAKRQLQDHRPHTLGLDSGCVYGFQLTGYLLEEDTLYHVLEIENLINYCVLEKTKST